MKFRTCLGLLLALCASAVWSDGPPAATRKAPSVDEQLAAQAAILGRNRLAKDAKDDLGLKLTQLSLALTPEDEVALLTLGLLEKELPLKPLATKLTEAQWLDAAVARAQELREKELPHNNQVASLCLAYYRLAELCRPGDEKIILALMKLKLKGHAKTLDELLRELPKFATAPAATAGTSNAAAKPLAPATAGTSNAAAKPLAPGAAWTVPDLGMEFVWIKALKLHVGKYEVTNGEYRQKEPTHVSKTDHVKGFDVNGDRQPVPEMTFSEAQAYAAWLTARERTAGRLPAGWQYRLPTEDEWLAIIRCGDQRAYPWGNEMPPKYGNYHDRNGAGTWGKITDYDDGFAVTCPVEKSGKNDWGLYGVGGNVWECTAGNSGGFGAWRGASWSDDGADRLRCTFRLGYEGSARIGGFRLVLSR